MIHPNTELRHISDVVGYGVFATRDIPKGTMVYVKDQLELIIDNNLFNTYNAELQDQVEKYSYIDEKGDRIVSWDFGKYVNHNCDSNTISTGYGFEIATRDIKNGEEITDEYGIFNLEYEMKCYCGAKNCRGMIRPNDFENEVKKWDERIKLAIFGMFSVEQPLLPYLEDSVQLELRRLMEHPELLKSVYSLRYMGAKSLQKNKIKVA